ncbi:zonadhesin-like [Cyclopterus lumpus]|uniref:zonadhesin-like n=1 Tax=Cyclopterus lumpus TaxID=8103 RepID=UPI0014869191|nr:zonadhesin-like [Cyclopterus lumpus]
MLGSIPKNVLVAVTLLFVTQTGTQCRAETDFSLVTLPDWRSSSEYVTQCFYDRHNHLICDWNQQTEDGVVTVLESGPLRLEGKACLEFWYLSSAATNGSEFRALLKSSVGLRAIWTLPALHTNAWRQVFVPLDIIEPGTQVVIKAVSMEGPFTFNRMGVRRGSCGPQCESDTELWTDESTRCLCHGGQLSCFPSQCPKGQICGPQIGRSSGISASGTCTIHSHTDCSTFDGEVFRFMAPCTYTLAKTCSPSEAMPMFSVEVVNEKNLNSSLPTVQQVIVEMGKFRVSLLKRQTHRIVVNGVWKKLPLKLGNGTFNIKSNPAAVELGSSFGLSVSYDNAGAVHLVLPSTYSDKVCGLCGNYNHFRNDDFRKPDGTIAHNATALAKSWQSGQATSSCETILVPHHCDPQEMAEYSSEPYCGGLLSSTGPFADCLSVLGAESYFRGCVVDMCSTHGDPVVLCEALQLYADICQEAGVSIPIWRNSTFCPLQCGENSHYNSCADGCPEVCSSLDIVGSCGSCEERCECDSGLKLSGGQCVPAEDCGCWYDGKHYEKGAAFWEGECVQMCHCMGNNGMQCITMQCADKEVCKVKDGMKGCFPFKPATCSVYGDPHYITFDGMAYDFQGGCGYTLTTTCGEESSFQFTVIGHNMHPSHQNFTRSKLEAVALQVEDLYLILNQSGEVYVNNSTVQLPYSTYGTYGSVWVDQKKNYIVLETTFGLRMTIDTRNRLFLQVDERYKYELCGLCGTYSERQDDDFVAPGGQNATGPFEFGDSWKVPGNNECISHPNDPKWCDYNEENQAYNECYTLLGDAFSPCHELIHPSIYLKSCVYDYCATSGDQHTLCESLKSYAAACQVAGVELPHWQTNTACVCPINCDFENNLCGWEQIVQDSFDWKRHSGPTPSGLTGPNQDHTTGAGFYMYIEGTNVTHGDSARLWSSMCHFNGPLCLHFWYHMSGSATAMALNIYLLKDNKATKLWVKMNNQGLEWYPGIVDIRESGPFHIIVEGIRGSNALSDVAIDDISIHFGSCSGSFPDLISGTVPPSTTVEVLPSLRVCNIDCSFDSNLCSWTQMVTDAFDWTRQSGSTPTLMTGPSAGHTGDGHYLYIEASNVTYGDTARLISSECSASGPKCLQFWYHMYGSADTMGLHVYLLQNRLADAVWWKRNNHGNMWQLAQVDITTTADFQIIIEGRRGSNKESDVAIDDVKLYQGQCFDVSTVVTSAPKPDGNTTLPIVPEPTNFINWGHVTEDPDIRLPPYSICQLNCNFEQDLCQWNQLLTDVFDWTRYRGSTPTKMTGPSSDHTTGEGHYLYIEANSASHGDTARLISSECSDSGPQCLQFWYHMYGSADTLGLHVYLFQDRKANAVWRKRNDQGNMWHMAQVDLTTTGAFQIIIEGRRGSNDQSDVAIDDVSLHHGQCTETVGTELPPANTSTTTQTSISLKPQPTLTTTFTTTTTTTTRSQQPITSTPITTSTTGPQTTATPSPTTAHPGVGTPEQPEPEMTARPEQPATSTNGPQTTPRPDPPTTAHPGVGTPEQPELEFTEKTQTTARPGPPATSTNGPQTTARPYPPTTVLPGVETPEQPEPEKTARPEQPATSTNGPQTTARPHPLTTVHPGVETPEQPKPEFTEKPQMTARPEQTATATNGPQTTARPHPLTTVHPGFGTSEQPEPEMTARPEQPATSTNGPQTTARPDPPTTAHPGVGTPEQPEPEMTARPEQPATSTNGPQTTARPDPPTTVHPGVGTPEQPELEFTEKTQTTARPGPPATSTNGPQTTARPHPLTTVHPGVGTSEQPEPEMTARPEQPATSTNGPQTTARPHPLTTVHPGVETPEQPKPEFTEKPQTTARPGPPATATNGPPTTARPYPPTTVRPGVETPEPEFTEKPQTTARPEQTAISNEPPTTISHETTAGSQPPTTVRLQPSTEIQPEPPTTAQPQPPTTVKHQSTTASPQPTTTAGPQPSTTNKPHSTTDRPRPTTTARTQSPTPHLPTPSCPVNSHYTTCVPPCSPTCKHLNGPPGCSDNEGCEKGCVCDEGFVYTWRACVPIQQCGCVDRNGTGHHFNEVWYTNHCSQKCECEKDHGVGKIDCDDKDECDGNAVCLQNVEGNYYCQSTDFNECTIRGDPEYRTFDKMKHEFNGKHSYVLVRTNNLPNYLPHVYIEGINDDDDSQHHGDSSSEEHHSHRVRDEDDEDEDEDEDDEDEDDAHKHHHHSEEEDREHYRLKELKIRVYNHTVVFKKNKRLIVDGRETNTPASPTAGLNIWEHSSRIYLKTDFGLSVEFDGRSRAEIILPHLYKRKVGGLCGNFDGHRVNDWMKSDGTRARSLEEFGESWRV